MNNRNVWRKCCSLEVETRVKSYVIAFNSDTHARMHARTHTFTYALV